MSVVATDKKESTSQKVLIAVVSTVLTSVATLLVVALSGQFDKVVNEVAARRIASQIVNDEARLDTLASRVVEKLSDVTGEAVELYQEPSGLIAAFDRACPDGWRDANSSAARVLIGEGDGFTLGDKGGSGSHVLTVDELPDYAMSFTTSNESHDHGINVQFSTADGLVDSDNPRAGQTSNSRYTAPASETFNILEDAHAHSGTAASGGGGEAHNNLPPYVVVRFCTPDR